MRVDQAGDRITRGDPHVVEPAPPHELVELDLPRTVLDEAEAIDIAHVEPTVPSECRRGPTRTGFFRF